MVLTVVAAVAVATSCSSSSSGETSNAVPTGNSQAGRPATNATLQITSPAPNADTATSVEVTMRLVNAHLVAPTQVGGQLSGDRGHIHLSVDGALVAMPLRLDERLPRLAPGPHTIEAEFVASDHLPFANRVVAAVTFRVR
jgi:hypothetical protein